MLLTLATESLHKGIWYPTILGVLVVVAAVVLFLGSIYVLLGTNLGARLGFLVAFTGLAGFMVILSLLWCTTASPLNTLKGRIPQWKVQEVIASPEKSKTSDVHDIKQKQFVAEATEAANVKAAVDAALVTKVIDADGRVHAQRQPLRQVPGRHQVHDPPDVGDRRQQPAVLEGRVHPHARVRGGAVLPGAGGRRSRSVCRRCRRSATTSADAVSGYVVLFRDLGSLRVPAFVAFGMSLILFILGLLGLHWRERDQQKLEEEAKAAAAGPVAVPDPDEPELTKV